LIIGVSGRIGSGKTEFARLAESEFNATVVNFAGELKKEVDGYLHQWQIAHSDASLWGHQDHKAERNIRIPMSCVTLEMQKHGFKSYGVSETSDLIQLTSGRELLQFWAEWKRAINSNYWVHKLFAEIEDSDFVVIDDVRYTNEADMIRICDGYVLRVNRIPAFSNSTHIGEVQLDNYPGFCMTITNDSSLESYHKLCREVLTHYRRSYLDAKRGHF